MSARAHTRGVYFGSFWQFERFWALHGHTTRESYGFFGYLDQVGTKGEYFGGCLGFRCLVGVLLHLDRSRRLEMERTQRTMCAPNGHTTGNSKSLKSRLTYQLTYNDNLISFSGIGLHGDGVMGLFGSKTLFFWTCTATACAHPTL